VRSNRLSADRELSYGAEQRLHRRSEALWALSIVVLAPVALLELGTSAVFVVCVGSLAWATAMRPALAVTNCVAVLGLVAVTIARDAALRSNPATLAFALLAVLLVVRSAHLNALAKASAERERLTTNGIDAILWEELPDAGRGGAVRVSGAAERLLGYPADRWREPGFWSSVIHEDDLPLLVATLRGESDLPCTIRFRHVDGSWRWFESRTSRSWIVRVGCRTRTA